MSPPVPCSTRKARRRRSPSDTTSRPLRARSSAWAACLIHRDTRRDIRAPSSQHGSSDITVNGNVFAWDANTVLLNGITVKGNVRLIGSEGTATAPSGRTAIPWSIKTNTIGGNLMVGDMTPIWFGLLVNQIGGNVILFNIHITDGLPPNNDPKPTIYVASNTIGRNLICWGLGPSLSGGFPGEVNIVGGQALGQCANLQNGTNDRRPTEAVGIRDLT